MSARDADREYASTAYFRRYCSERDAIMAVAAGKWIAFDLDWNIERQKFDTEEECWLHVDGKASATLPLVLRVGHEDFLSAL